MSTPLIKAIAEATVAGKMAYDIIDRKPLIPIDNKNAKMLNNVSGKIEFRNVSFTYPTRKE